MFNTNTVNKHTSKNSDFVTSRKNRKKHEKISFKQMAHAGSHLKSPILTGVSYFGTIFPPCPLIDVTLMLKLHLRG
jgi:hypothetical protein